MLSEHVDLASLGFMMFLSIRREGTYVVQKSGLSGRGLTYYEKFQCDGFFVEIVLRKRL